MRDINTMSKVGYVCENIIWCIITIRIYKIYCFTNFLEFDDETSKWILYIMASVFVLIGLAVTLNHRRNTVNTAINIALPLSIYTIIAYFRYIGVFVAVLLALAFVASVLYVVMTQEYSKSKAGKENKKFNKNRFSFLGARAISTACCSLIVFYLFGTSVTGFQLFRPNIGAEQESTSFSDYFEKNMETIALLEESRWEGLTTKEQLDVLQIVCNVEKARWGISHPIYIKSRAFKSDLLACYNNADHTVLINTSHLKDNSSMDILISILHECRHAYQHSLVDLYNSANGEQKNLAIFDVVKTYKAEFSDYKDGDYNYLEYYCQSVEEDSRNYSEHAANEYRDKILIYLDSRNKS